MWGVALAGLNSATIGSPKAAFRAATGKAPIRITVALGLKPSYVSEPDDGPIADVGVGVPPQVALTPPF